MLTSKAPLGVKLLRLSSHPIYALHGSAPHNKDLPPTAHSASVPQYCHVHTIWSRGAAPLASLTTHVNYSRRWQHGSSSSANVLRSHLWLDDLPNADIVSTMFDRFQKWPHLTAIVDEGVGRSYSYGEIEDCSLRIGAAYKSVLGGKTPTCVAIFSPNVPEYPIAVFGALAVGSTATTVASMMTSAEVASQLTDSDADVVVVDPSLEDTLQEALQLMETSAPPVVLVNGPSANGFTNLLEIIKSNNYPKAERVENSPDKVAIIPYSSGTTGKPKGVCLTHKSVTNSLAIFTHHEFYPVKKSTTSQDVSIGLMPYYHSFGLFVLCFSSFYLGTKMICLSKFTPMQYAELVEKYQVSTLHIVPPLLNFLAHSPLVTSQHLSTVRNVMIASAPVHPAVVQAFIAKTHHSLHFQEGLGMTETLGLMVTPLSEERIGYCGKLLANIEARIVDITTGENLGPNKPGELWVRGPGFFSHYYNNPEATASSFGPGGWFKTGDVVTYTDDGFFSVVDRLKELIKVKAYQVSPTELEELILQVPEVGQAGVVGVPDDRAGELPRAYIVLKTPSDDPGVQEAVRTAIDKHLKEKASEYKQLAGGIVFLDDLPKNPTGKMMRKKLKNMAQSSN